MEKPSISPARCQRVKPADASNADFRNGNRLPCKGTMKTLRIVTLLGAIALLLVIPFTALGYSGNDYLFHLTSWMEMRSAWSHGVFVPGWATRANFGLGSPRFCFYPPVSIWIGVLLSFILPWRIVPGAFVWLMVVIGGASMYVASALFIREEDRLPVTVLYSVSPYLLITAIHRFDAAELCALSVLPLVVGFYFRAVWCLQGSAVLPLALLLALTNCTDVPAAIALAYMLFLGCLVAACVNRLWGPLIYYVTAGTLSIAISAFTLLPPLYEQRWISVKMLYRGNDFHQFFLLALFGDANLSFRIVLWMITLTAVGISIACMVAGRSPFQLSDRMLITFVCIASVAQLPVIAPLWNYLPELKVVQYPFRFLSFYGVCVPLLLLSSGAEPRLRRSAYAVLAATALLAYGGYWRHALGRDGGAHPEFGPDFNSLQAGYPGWPEYIPRGGKWAYRLTSDLPPGSVRAIGQPGCHVALVSRGYLSERFAVTSAETCRLHVETYYYPFWRATDGSGAPLSVSADPGNLLVVSVPLREHDVRLWFHATSHLRIVADWMTVVAIVLVFGAQARNWALKRREGRVGESASVP